jgi:hypothetical protein
MLQHKNSLRKQALSPATSSRAMALQRSASSGRKDSGGENPEESSGSDLMNDYSKPGSTLPPDSPHHKTVTAMNTKGGRTKGAYTTDGLLAQHGSSRFKE